MTKKIKQLYKKTFTCQIDKIEKLKGDGSDRAIFRLFSKNKSVIGIHGKNTKENESFIYLTNHFEK